ncbi:MAG: hypothetical protein KKF56_01380 [Nanoarchaeota archaeon]|nr:hypothetical protein [Nanoarchaeota archaeon]
MIAEEEKNKPQVEEKKPEVTKPVTTPKSEDKIKTEDKKEQPEEKETKDKKSDKKPEKKIEKKDKGEVNVHAQHISTKHAIAICKFILKKQPFLAVNQLEEVVKMKRAIPMRGEIPHRKGMMSGRYPINAAKIFIKLIKQLQANAEVNGLEEPIIISKAMPNVAARPMRRFGSRRFKRTNIQLVAIEKKPSQKNKGGKK